MRNWLLASIAILAPFPVAAQTPAPVPTRVTAPKPASLPAVKPVAVAVPKPAAAPVAAKPTLIVAIAVDQFSTDLFNEYRPYYTRGLKRMTQGVVFPRGHQGHAATETCPGHSTILTGSRPARTGIVANDWQDPQLERKNKDGKPTFEIYCAEKPGAPGSNAAEQVASSAFLRVPTLGDRLKATDPRSRTFAVSGKDRAAIMMGGHKADATIWWNGKTFGTYAGKKVALGALNGINVRAAAAVAKPVKPLLPRQCQGHSRAVPIAKDASVGTLQPRKPGDAGRWRATPQFDAMTMDIALAGLNEWKLGQGASTDVLAISLSATDYVGHAFGTGGAETCGQIMALDATLGRLFAALDKSKVRYVAVLTADHGGHDLPERNRVQGLPAAQRVELKLSASAMGKVVGAQFGLTDSALIGRASFGDMYLAASVPQRRRAAVRAAAVSAYRAHPQVEAVFTRDQLIAAPSPAGPVDEWSLIERAKASFDPDRSGDFLVLLKEYVTPIPDPNNGYVATHGSPWGYDRRVPIIFLWKGARGFEQPNAVETADILPTLASFVALKVPSIEIDGRCLDLIAGAESNCR